LCAAACSHPQYLVFILQEYYYYLTAARRCAIRARRRDLPVTPRKSPSKGIWGVLRRSPSPRCRVGCVAKLLSSASNSEPAHSRRVSPEEYSPVTKQFTHEPFDRPRRGTAFCRPIRADRRAASVRTRASRHHPPKSSLESDLLLKGNPKSQHRLAAIGAPRTAFDLGGCHRRPRFGCPGSFVPFER
jgi:hypothetical protein